MQYLNHTTDQYDTDEYTTKGGERVSVLALCEQDFLRLKPGVLYLFEPLPGCDKCAEIADDYAEYGFTPEVATPEHTDEDHDPEGDKINDPDDEA